MTSAKKKVKYTYEEYLTLEEQAEYKSEYYQGEIFAMSGGTPEHSLINSNVNRELGNSLKGSDCFVYDSNLKVRVEAADLGAYPDVLVICGPREQYKDRKDIVTNPTLVVEVLSDSTAAYDRGLKFQNYGLLPSLKEYMLVEQDFPLVEVFRRGENSLWVLQRYRGLSAEVEIQSLKVSIPASEIYYGVDFE